MVSISALVSISIARLAHFYVTGFLLSDEGLYLLSGIVSAERGNVVVLYPNRLLYQVVFALVGIILNLDNAYKMVSFALVSNLLYSIICILLSHKIVATFFPKYRNYLYVFILAFPTLIMFDIATVAVLTESMTYMFLLLGAYSFLKAVDDKSLSCSFLSGIAFGLTYFMREPFAVLTFGIAVISTVLLRRGFLSRRQFVLIIIPIILLSRIPVAGGVNLSRYFIVEVSVVAVNSLNGLLSWLSTLILPASIPPALPVPDIESLTPTDIGSTDYVPSINSTGDFFAHEQRPNQMFVPANYSGIMSGWGNLVPSPQGVLYAVFAASVGMFLGWNPAVFVVAIVGVTLLMRERRRLDVHDEILVVLSILVVFSFVGSVYISGQPSPEQSKAGILVPYGSVIRLSHSSLFATFLILPALKYIEPLFRRRRLVLTSIVIGITVMTLFVAINSFQVQWSSDAVDHMSFSYRAPHLEAMRFSQTTGRTLLFGGVNVVQLSLFMRQMTTVFISRPPANESDMSTFLEMDDWDTVLIYGITHWTSDPALGESFPFFWRLLNNATSYTYSVVFRTGEAYLLKVDVSK